MKTSNQQGSNSHVFISEELQDRLDTNQLFRSPEPSKKNVKPNEDSEEKNHPDQVTIFFKDTAFPCVYDLTAWQSETVTVLVPPAHLARFFDLHYTCAEMTLFDKDFLCVDSVARKKDGDWFVTIFLRS